MPTERMREIWYCPPNIDAPHYNGREQRLCLGVSDDITGKRTPHCRKTPLFMVWAHAIGRLPPIHAISHLAESAPTPTLTTLDDATACFRGIHRPHLREDNGDNVITYILKPEVSIEFAASMACLARAVSPPTPFVITMQVVLNECLQVSHDNVAGIITRVEPIGCDLVDPTLPVEYQTRYGQRCW
jgi:hypothetical protein